MTDTEAEEFGQPVTDTASDLATRIMALDWRARKDWTVDEQADRYGELQEMIFEALAAETALAAREVATDAVPVRYVRHKKRGSVYQVMGEGEIQISTTCVRDGEGGVWPNARVIKEGDKLVVYRCEADGNMWVRFPDEFEDGRFEEAASPTPPAPAPEASDAL